MTGEEAAARAVAAQQAHAEKTAELRALEHERAEAVADLRRQGWTYARIAALLGVSRARAHQLAPNHPGKGSGDGSGG